MQFTPRFKPRSTRLVALSTGLVLACAAFSTSPAQAMEKSKKLKYGAIAAGVVGAYLLSKGKTVPAAAVAAGGYYAYKKSQDARDQERFGSNSDYNDNRYGYNPDRGVYPDDEERVRYRANALVLQPERKQGKKANKNFDLSPYLR